jgi:hypothetical protein
VQAGIARRLGGNFGGLLHHFRQVGHVGLITPAAAGQGRPPGICVCQKPVAFTIS